MHKRSKLIPLLLTLLAAAAVTASLLALPPSAASAAGLPPTPTPAASNAGGAARTSPLVGILVLLAPLVYLAWKSRGAKAPDIKAASCLPVIDESKRPFRIQDDPPEKNS